MDALVALGSWTGGVAAAVARAKLVARREVLRAAGERIGLALAAAGHVGAGDGAAAVVAVPSDRRRSRRRGGDHTAALAAGAAAALGVPVVRPFAPARGTTDRVAGGGSSNRPVHVDVPPVARPAVVADADLVVVDDVVTTGATIAAVAHALRAAGARRVVAGVVGRAGARSLVGAPQERP